MAERGSVAAVAAWAAGRTALSPMPSPIHSLVLADNLPP